MAKGPYIQLKSFWGRWVRHKQNNTNELEYATAVWDTRRQKDINAPEQVQRQAARCVYNTTQAEHPGAPQVWLTSLETWRRKTDSLCCIISITDPDSYLQKNDRRNRGEHRLFEGRPSMYHQVIPQSQTADRPTILWFSQFYTSSNWCHYVYRDIVAPINGVARTLKKLRTSKGDYWIQKRLSSFASLLKIGTSCSQMKNHFYHIRWPPLNITIFITHVRNGSYANAHYY